MSDYKQVIKEAELALSKGEYNLCVEILNPKIDSFKVSTLEGINLRMLLITALSGLNRNEEAIKLCKPLTKSKYAQIRDESLSLMQILNSPNLQIPENWNIKFESNLISERSSSLPQKIIKNSSKEEKYINITDSPTGETKTFQKGFLISTFFLLIILLTLLSGCVKIDNTIDLRDIEALNIDLQIESKYLNKIPWQVKLEEKLKENFPNKEIKINDKNLLLNKKKLNLNDAELFINKILKIISNTINIDLKNMTIKHFKNNYLLLEKHFYEINLDLINLNKIDELEINMNIINPSKISISDKNEKISTYKNIIYWQLIPGINNTITFSYWCWNEFILGTLIVILLVTIAYYVRRNRFAIGSNLPELPS
tara:strand:+ start:79 stop:1185 length:1107 start_codon:yes stop_codon:yes gene_type:complete